MAGSNSIVSVTVQRQGASLNTSPFRNTLVARWSIVRNVKAGRWTSARRDSFRGRGFGAGAGSSGGVGAGLAASGGVGGTGAGGIEADGATGFAGRTVFGPSADGRGDSAVGP